MPSGTVRVEMGYVNDQFTKNLVTMRGEVEIAPVVGDVDALMLVAPSS